MSIETYRGHTIEYRQEKALYEVKELDGDHVCFAMTPMVARSKIDDRLEPTNPSPKPFGSGRRYPESHEPASLSFSTIGAPRLTVRIDTDLLSPRDKVELFRALMDDLGITERFHDEPDACARAQEIIVEQWGRAWDTRRGA